ncbi:MAG TPA: efflux RND transporter periplasmic adaptor subunit [Vicinamibacterales bacterium]
MQMIRSRAGDQTVIVVREDEDGAARMLSMISTHRPFASSRDYSMAHVTEAQSRGRAGADVAITAVGDVAITAVGPPVPAPRPRRRRSLALAALLLIAAAGAAAWRAGIPAATTVRVAGVVEANEAVVSATATGRMRELRVDEGDRVEAGAVVAVLDSAELEAARDRYTAALSQLAAKLSQSQELVSLEADRFVGRQAVALAALSAANQLREEATAELEQRRADAARAQELFQQGLVPRQEFERRMTDVRLAEAQLESRSSAVTSAEAELTLARTGQRQVTVVSSDVERTRAEMRQAQAQLAEVDARLGETVIRAPLSGVVAVRVARPGEVIEAGRPIVTIVDDGDRWVRAAVDESFAGRLRLGQTVDVEMASGARISGTVTQIAAAAEFATRRDVDRVRRDVRSLGFKVALPRDAGGAYPGLTAYVYLPAASVQ